MKPPHPIRLLALLLFAFGGLYGATNVSPVHTPPPATTPVVDPDNAVLTWSAGPGEVAFRVYLGTTSLSQRAHTSGTQKTLTDLDPDSYYQWRVDAYDEDRRLVGSRGTVWTFRTGPGDSRKAHTPVPAHGSVVTTGQDNVLSWSAGSGAVSHNVYFGKDSTPDETEFRGNLTGNPVDLSYFAGILKPNTQYFWRIDSIVDVNGTVVPGRVWSFRTNSTAVEYDNIITIIYADDFENGVLNDAPVGWQRANARAQLRAVSGRPGKSVKISQTTWIERAISTEDMSDIHVSYRCDLAGYATGEGLTVEWSSDGATWHTLESIQTGSFNDPLTIVECGAGADRQAGFRLRFRSTSASTSAYAFIDSLQVRGVASPVVPARDTNHDIANAKVIFLGDSLTSNNGSLRNPDDGGKEHWTDLLQQRFNLQVLSAHAYDPNDHSCGSRLITHGKGGSRAYYGSGATLPTYHGDDAAHPNLGGYQRLKYAFWEADQDPNDQLVKPDFVIINFGMNDHKRVWKNGVSTGQSSPAQFNSHLKQIVDLALAHGVHPVLVTAHDFYQGSPDDLESYYSLYSPLLFDNAEDNYSALGRYTNFLDQMREVAKGSVAEGRPPIDLIELNRAAAAYDGDEFTTSGGVHLEKLGHDVYAEVIGDFLSARFGDLPPPPPPVTGNFVLSASGGWHVGSNWNRGQTPSDINNVYIRDGLTATVSTDVGTVQRFYLGDNATTYPPGTGTLTISGGKLISALTAAQVGRQNTPGAFGRLNLSAGLLQLGAAGDLVLNIGVDTATAGVTGEVVVCGGELRGRILLGSSGVSGATADRLRIQGSSATLGSTAAGLGLDVAATGTLEFIFDASGVSPLNYPAGTARFQSGSHIVVDGAGYTGGAGNFVLLQCVSFDGTPTIDLQNFPAGTTSTWSTATGTFTVAVAP